MTMLINDLLSLHCLISDKRLPGSKDFCKLVMFDRRFHGKSSARKQDPQYWWPGRLTSKLCEDPEFWGTLWELFRNDGHKM